MVIFHSYVKLPEGTCGAYDPVCCLRAVARHRARLPQGVKIHPYVYLMRLYSVWSCLPSLYHCILLCKRTVPLGPTFSCMDVHFVTCVVPLHSPVRISQNTYTIEIYYSVRKESGEFNIFRKCPCKMCADGVLTCSIHFLVDLSRDAWLHASELCIWDVWL